jgi:hypothetical protein
MWYSKNTLRGYSSVPPPQRHVELVAAKPAEQHFKHGKRITGNENVVACQERIFD